MGELAVPIRGRQEPVIAGRLSSDERLAKLVCKGSARAFALLYQRHHQALYRYCRSIVRDGEDAEDALQSAMTRAFAALRAGERDLAVRPWLFRIAHNEAVSILRRRRPHAELDELQVPALEDVESSLARRERFGELLGDLQALGERQRAALLMRELSGLSLQEIAGALSITPGTAKQALFEARTTLHEFAQGRTMECEAVRQAICEDRRMLRGRRIRAHLRQCEACGALEAQIATRGEDLRALAPPLPAAAAAAMLGRVLAGAGAGGHSAAALSGTALGKQAALSLTTKAVAGVAVMAVAVGGTARLALHHSPAHHRAPAATQADHRGGQAIVSGAPAPAGSRAAAKHAAAQHAHSRLGQSTGPQAGSTAAAPGAAEAFPLGGRTQAPGRRLGAASRPAAGHRRASHGAAGHRADVGRSTRLGRAL